MNKPYEIIALTKIEPELFTNDEGEFPTFITLVTFPEPAPIVTLVLGRMEVLFYEQHTASLLDFNYEIQPATIVRNEFLEVEFTLTPDTLILILDYIHGQRLITLELSASPNSFTIH